MRIISILAFVDLKDFKQVKAEVLIQTSMGADKGGDLADAVKVHRKVDAPSLRSRQGAFFLIIYWQGLQNISRLGSGLFQLLPRRLQSL